MINKLQNSYALVSLPANYPVSLSSISANQNSVANPVLSQIPQGMKAMTVRVDATTAVEGWAGSGSSVDLLLIEKEQTLLIAENVKILSAERSVQPVDQVTPNIPSTV